MLLVDRLLTESTLGAAIESQNRYLEAMELASDLKPAESTSHKVDLGNVSSTGKLVECRICQDEDDDRNMETPCSCCGSLKVSRVVLSTFSKMLFICFCSMVIFIDQLLCKFHGDRHHLSAQVSCTTNLCPSALTGLTEKVPGMIL